MINKLEFDSLFLEFGQHRVLSNIYVKCQTGEVIGLLGRNGSGKSCLMKIVFGTMRAEFKSVRINGKYYAGNTRNHVAINYLSQESFIPTFLSLNQVLRLYKIHPYQLTDYFPEFNIMLDMDPDLLSGGLRRLAEVMIILEYPSLFSILDEPFSGLMPLHIEKLKEIIGLKKHTKGIIITDHLYTHITDLSDSLYLLSAGQTYPITNSDQLIYHGYISEK